MKKFLLLLTAVIATLFSAYAQESVTYDFKKNDYGLSRGGSYFTTATLTNTPITLDLAATVGPGYKLMTGGLRPYRNGGSGAGKGTFTFAITSGKITEIVITGNTSHTYTCTEGQVNKSGATTTWTGSSSEVVLTWSTSSNNDINTIVVKYEAQDDNRTPVTLTWSETTASATLGQDFTAPILTADPAAALSEVKYESSKPEIASIDAEGNVTLGTNGGTTTIKASIVDSETYKNAFAEYVLTVTDPNAKNYTLITSTSELYDGAMGIIACQSKDDAMGIVQNDKNRGLGTITFNGDKSEILTYEDNVAIVRFDLVDAEKGQYAMYVTNGTDASGNTKCGYLQQLASGENQLTVVDTKVPATISISANGTATIEVTKSGSTKYYIERNTSSIFYSAYKGTQTKVQLYIMPNASSKDKAGLSYKTTTYTIEKGDAFTAPTIENPNNIEGITYESNAPEVAAVDPATGAVTIKGIGVATITAKSAETDKYLEGSASYTITVNGAVDNLADFIALGSKYDVTLTANFTSTVTYANGSHIYLTDGENYGYMYMSNLNLKDGDVIPEGWKGKITIFNTTTVEITNVTGIAAEGLENKPVNPTAVTSISTDMENQYVVVYGVEFENGITTTTDNKTFTGLLGSQEIKCYNRDGLEDVPAGYYEVKGIVTVYQGTPQITLSHLWANPEKPVFQGTAEGTEWPSTLQEGMVLTWTVKYGTLSYVDNNQQPSQVAAYAAEANTAWNVSADGKTITYTVPADTKGINYSIINTVNGVKSEEAKLIVGEDGSVSGVQDVVIDNAPAVYYNLQGVRVEHDLTPGLYIRRQGNTTSKVIVR